MLVTKSYEVEEIILTRQQRKQLDNPQLRVCLPSDYHFTASPRGRDAMWCVFFCNLSQQPLVCPLVVCFVWQKSAVVQAVDRRQLALLLPRKAMTSCVSWAIITLLGNLRGCGKIIAEWILIHLWFFKSWLVNILSVLGILIFFFFPLVYFYLISTDMSFLTNRTERVFHELIPVLFTFNIFKAAISDIFRTKRKLTWKEGFLLALFVSNQF